MSILFAQRVRLLATLAGLAWLLGVVPTIPVRLLAVVLVALAVVLDTVSDRTPAGTRPAAPRGRGQ